MGLQCPDEKYYTVLERTVIPPRLPWTANEVSGSLILHPLTAATRGFSRQVHNLDTYSGFEVGDYATRYKIRHAGVDQQARTCWPVTTPDPSNGNNLQNIQ